MSNQDVIDAYLGSHHDTDIGGDGDEPAAPTKEDHQ